jgi:hypothetical protein
MKCPSCGNEQADGWLSCQRCHIIFARWKLDSVEVSSQSTATEEAAASELPWQESKFAYLPPKQTRFQEGEPLPHPRRQLSWAVYLVLIVPFAVALYLLLNPRARAEEPGSYRDSRNFFAIRAPEGWLTLTKDNYDAIMRQYGSLLPANLSRTGEFSPSMNVVIVKSAPPPINEKSKQEAAKAIAGGFAAQFTDYKQESVKIIEVDGIRSLEIISTASLPFQFSSERSAVTLALRFRQVLVPGKKLAYILTFTARRNMAEDAEAEFQDALDSFRVLKRPPRFSPMLNGVLIGGLIAAMFFLFHAMLLSLGGERIR